MSKPVPTHIDTPPTELDLDHALDAAAERLANPKECTCERCEDAVTDMRRELIAEGQRRSERPRNWQTISVKCANCGGDITAGPQWGDDMVGCPKCGTASAIAKAASS